MGQWERLGGGGGGALCELWAGFPFVRSSNTDLFCFHNPAHFVYQPDTQGLCFTVCVCQSLSLQLYLKSPERVGGVGVSVEEPGGLCPCAQQILRRQTLRL